MAANAAVLPSPEVWITSTGVRNTEKSALFISKTFKTGVTQYGDAMLRASFWKQVSRKAWHVRLGTPTVSRLWTLHVPSGHGETITDSSGDIVSLVDINWLDAQIRRRAASKSATTLPILLAGDVVLCNNFVDRGSAASAVSDISE